MRFSPWLAAALAAAVPAPLLAQAAPAAPVAPAAPQSIGKADYLANMQREFTEIDANKDGTVTTAEVETARSKAVADAVQRRAAAAFAQLDADKNGTLTPAEFAKVMKPADKLPPSPLLSLDGNKDGRITGAEYKTGIEGRFARLDANKDGVVTAAEVRPATPSR